MKKHDKSIVRFFQILFASVVFSALTFCTSLKAQESFDQEFKAKCYRTEEFIARLGDYTAFNTELLYKDKESAVYDVLIGVNKTKAVIVAREFTGKYNVTCVLSTFLVKNKV